MLAYWTPLAPLDSGSLTVKTGRALGAPVIGCAEPGSRVAGPRQERKRELLWLLLIPNDDLDLHALASLLLHLANYFSVHPLAQRAAFPVTFFSVH